MDAEDSALVRNVSLCMIRARHRGLHIPAEVLVQEPAAPYYTAKPKRRKRAA